MSKRRVALVLVAVLLGVVAWWLLRGSGGPSGPERLVYGAMALGPTGEEALLAGRTDSPQAKRFFLEVVTIDGLRWDAETTPLKVETMLGLVSAVSDEARVYALLLEDDPGRGGEVRAFAREDGRQLWARPLPRLRDDVPKRYLRRLPLCPSVRLSETRVLTLVQDVAAGVMAVDKTTGAELWKVGLDPEMAKAFEVGPKKAAVLSRGLALIDLETGVAAHAIEAFGSTCRAGDRLLVRQRSGLTEVPLDGGELKSLGVADAVPWIEACAAHGDGWVVAGMKGGALTMQRVAGDKVIWETELPGTGFSMLGGPSNGADQGDGRLAGHWPVVIYATTDNGQQVDRLVVVDLESGKITSTREGDGAAIRIGEAFAAGARQGSVTVLGPDGSERLTLLTGHGIEVVESLVANGRLWLVPMLEMGAPGLHRRTVVNIATGRVVGGAGVPLEVDKRGLSGAFPRAL